jgi:hypothetical protein
LKAVSGLALPWVQSEWECLLFYFHVIAIHHRLDGTGFEPDESEIFWTHQYRSRDPPCLLYKGYPSVSQGYSSRGVAVIMPLLLAPVSSRLDRNVYLLSVPAWRIGRALHFCLATGVETTSNFNVVLNCDNWQHPIETWHNYLATVIKLLTQSMSVS